jgi:hypothetical protein
MEKKNTSRWTNHTASDMGLLVALEEYYVDLLSGRKKSYMASDMDLLVALEEYIKWPTDILSRTCEV